MPYVIRKRGDKHCVVSTTSGKTHGCHDSRAKAIKQQRALYANAPEAANEDAVMAPSGPPTAGLGMIALYPRPEEASAIAVEGGLEVDDLHVTLVFLGDVGTFDEAAVTAAVGDVAASHEALVGEVGGEGHFSINADGIPVILLPDVPELGSVRENIVHELLEYGIESPSEHGFLPHITQIYVESLENITPNADLFHQELHFDAVSVVLGDRRLDYPFGGEDMSSVFTSSDESPTLPRMTTQRLTPEKEEPKSSIWNLRLTPETKRLWSEAAEAEKMNLSEYVRDIVTEQALAKLKEDEEPNVTLEAAAAAIDELAAAGLSEEEITAGAEGTVDLAVAIAEGEASAAADDVDETRESWEGVLGTIGSPTSDSRYLVPGEIENRDLPLPFSVQPALADGHDGAINAGRIEQISYVPWTEFERKEEFYAEDQIAAMPDTATVIWGEGTADGSPAGQEAKRQIENGADVSLDGLRFNGFLYDAETFDQVTEEDVAELEMGEVFQKIMEGSYLQGVSGKIGGVTVVSIGAFEEARVIVTASASLHIVDSYNAAAKFATLVAAAGPVKPPAEWFEDPGLSELTPLTIDKNGRVFGHLADWDGCHIGFQGVCVPPFESQSNYAYFNVGQIETAEGTLVPCGKLMFCMNGNGHAPTDPQLSYRDVQRYYDDATKVGAFVRAGADRFGTWLAGALRPGLTDIEVQHLRTHGPSGDWRPIRGGDSDLIAAFAVPVQGFPIARPQSLVASAGGEITAIITAPLSLEKKYEELARLRTEQERQEKLVSDKHALLRRRAMLLAEFQAIEFPDPVAEAVEDSNAELAASE